MGARHGARIAMTTTLTPLIDALAAALVADYLREQPAPAQAMPPDRSERAALPLADRAA